MGWSLGYDDAWSRDIGYGVPAYCDHPGCFARINRGLAYVCGGETYGGERGCGLFFCPDHLAVFPPLCSRCRRHRSPYQPKPDHPAWVHHKLTDPSWASWCVEHPEYVQEYAPTLLPAKEPP